MVSVSAHLSRSTVPVLLCLSHPIGRQLPFILYRFLTFSARRLTSSQAGAVEHRKLLTSTFTSFQVENHGNGSNKPRPTRLRSGRGGSNIQKYNHRGGSVIRLVAPCASSQILPWQPRISSFEQLNYESSLDIDAQVGLRLVDDINHRLDPELWLALIRFRERLDGVKGIAVVWKGFSQRLFRCREPTFLQLAPPEAAEKSWRKVWMSFLPAGFEDHQILREICEHIRLNIRGRRRKFNGLYVAVIGHILKVEPSEAFSWHQRLKDFPPDPEGQIELFDQTVASLPARQALLAIYADLPYPRIYSSIIPRLFARELYDDAISWHRMLLSRGDRPMSASVIEPLLEHLASSGNWKLSARVMAELVDAGVPFDATGNPIQEDIPVVSRQTMNEMHAKFYNFTPKRFSDEFCARLLATKMFSVRSVISGLQMLSVQAIGPLALREIALRTVHNEACRPDEMAIHLDQLHEAKIQLGSSTFSRLVERLVREKYDQLLYDVVISDQHPDVLEDNKLQESLLATHLRTGDKRQINRAIAVLTLDVKDEAIDTAYWNILFRCNLTLLDTSALLKTTEVMYVKGLPLTHMSRSYMWSKLMNPGELVHSTTKEHAQTLISIWQGFMIRGTIIPLTDWVKTLRRLGMTGQLKAYENLAFWLAKWYTDDRFGKSLIGTLNGADQLEASGKYSMPPTQTNSIHPLLILFPNYAQVTLLAWGFQMIKMTDLTSCMPSERVSKLAASDALWGLRMIARLRDFGINIDRATISRLCQTHLKRIFGLTRNSRNRDHHISVGSKGRWDEYVLAMEMIWGNDFFTKSSRIKGNTEQPSSAREPSLKTSAETFWSTEKKQNDAGMQRRLPSITSAVGAKQRSFLRINDSF